MTEAVEFLLSEETVNRINKPYLSMSKEEKEYLAELRERYDYLSYEEQEYIEEHGDAALVTKLSVYSLENSIENVLSEISEFGTGWYWGDFAQLRQFCLINHIDFDDFFGNIHEELRGVKVRRSYGEYIPLYEIESFKKCVDKSLELIGDKEEYIKSLLEKDSFDEIEANILKLSGINLDEANLSEQQRLTLLMGTSNNGILEFLKTKPEKLIYQASNAPIIGALINYLNKEQIDELFESINDDEYEARLLLSADITGIDQISYLFPRLDRYMQTQIVCVKHKDKRQTIEQAEEKIKHYAEIRSTFFKLSKEERAEFLANLYSIESIDFEAIGSYSDNNEIKKSLLEYLETQEERDLVIDSLERFVAPELEFYVETAERIIEEFFESHGGLSPQEKERMKIALKSMDFDVENYQKAATQGCTYHLDHYVSVRGSNLNNPSATLFYMLHVQSVNHR